MRGPEQQPPPPQVGTPGERIDPLGIFIEPSRHQLFGDRCCLRPGGDGGQVAQPGEAVDIFGKRPAPFAALERQRVDRVRLAAKAQFAAQQRLAAAHVADDGIVGHRDQLQRVAALEAHCVKRGAPGQLVEAFGQALGEAQALVAADAHQALALLDPIGKAFGRNVVHAWAGAPRSAAMFAA
jgi:hypothetical protein